MNKNLHIAQPKKDGETVEVRNELAIALADVDIVNFAAVTSDVVVVTTDCELCNIRTVDVVCRTV